MREGKESPLSSWIDTTCSQCGISMQKSRSRYQRSKNHFCSRQCTDEWKRSQSDRDRKDKELIRSKFYERVVMSDEDSCWLWVGSYSAKGYGEMPGGHRHTKQRAHRASFEIHVGSIPAGMVVCHHCDNPSCVNPFHLFVGTHNDNMRDMKMKGRRRGSRQPKAILHERDIPHIRRLRREGVMVKDIAAKFGVAPQTIAHIINKRSWTHVRDET